MEFDKKDAPQSIEVLTRMDKAKILGEARKLIQNPSISAPESRQIIGHVARLLLGGETLTEDEVPELVTGTMFSFRHSQPGLRQILHWLVKELSTQPRLDVEEFRTLFPNSVAGDAENKNLDADRRRGPGVEGPAKILRPNAIRALCRLYDATSAHSFAGKVDSAIVDSDTSVQSAALVSLYHTLPWGVQHLRGLQSQIQAAFTQTRGSASWAWPEYHALGLDYHGRVGSEMLARDFIRSGDGGFKRNRKLQGPAAKIFFARFAAELAEKSNFRSGVIEFLKEQLDSFESIEYDPTITGDKESFVLKRSMVALEAAKTICQIEDVDRGSLDEAVQKLVEMANNSHQVVKFAAMRTLCSVASTYPDTVRRHNDSIKKQMKSSNKDIGSFATTTLLKTADEADVDSLMKEVGSLMTNASNDFKVVIVEAVTALCLKFPAKKTALAKFLGDYLKDEGSYEFKRAMVEGMFDLVKSIPETKKDVLTQLCEFIEDCEYPSLTIRVLHVIGTEGPTVDHATPYIRYIYNRLVLENALVRAAAVTALSKFGVGQKEPELKRSVHVLLSRSLDDEDDEVRDRAALSLRLMEGEDEKSRELVRNDSMFSLAEFEDRLAMYVSTEDRSTFNEPFDLSQVPIISRDKALSEARTKKLLGPTTPKPPAASKSSRKGADDFAPTFAATQKKYTQELQAIPELAGYGNLLTSSPAKEIRDGDIVITVVKHFYSEHVVFQFNVATEMDGVVLEDVQVDSYPDSDNELYEAAEWTIPCNGVKKEQPGIVYSSHKKADDAGRYLPKEAVFSSDVHLIMKNVTNNDEQPFEENLDLFSVKPADFLTPAYAGSFDSVWEQLPKEDDQDGVEFILSQVTSVQEAAESLRENCRLEPLDGSETASAKYKHELKLYGKTIYGARVAALVRIVRQVKEDNIRVSVSARAEEEGVAAMLVASFFDE